MPLLMKDVLEVHKEMGGFTCNRCYKTYISGLTVEDDIECSEMVHIDWTGGYGSVFGDMDSFELTLCQDCFKEIMGLYVICTKKRKYL